MDDDDQRRADIIETLMCNFKVDLAMVAADQDFTEELASLQPMIVDGLVHVQGPLVEMTERGRSVVRVVAAIFDRYRWDTASRFSLAV